jgi:hypothetical protein
LDGVSEVNGPPIGRRRNFKSPMHSPTDQAPKYCTLRVFKRSLTPATNGVKHRREIKNSFKQNPIPQLLPHFLSRSLARSLTRISLPLYWFALISNIRTNRFETLALTQYYIGLFLSILISEILSSRAQVIQSLLKAYGDQSISLNSINLRFSCFTD